MSAVSKDQFVEYFLRYQRQLYHYIVSLVPHRADADEVFQQTSLTLWKVWDRYDPEREFMTWACGIAQNHVRNFVRKRKGEPALLSEDLVEKLGELWIRCQDELEDRQQALTVCLERLPPRHKALVEQCYGGEQSIKDIAESTGRTPNSMYKLLERIRAALYDCVAQTLAAGTLR